MFILAVTIGCGPSTARGPEPARPRVIELPRATSEPASLTAPVSRLPHCEIRGRREVGRVSLYLRSDDQSAAATLLRAGETELTWSEFAHGRAALSFRQEHVVRFSGFADYENDWFRLEHRVEVMPGMAWSWRGAEVSPESDDDTGRVLASFQTPFATPARLEARVDCADIGFEEIEPEQPSLPETGESLWRPGPELELYAAPSAAQVLRVTYLDATGYHQGVERVPGWVRIVEIGGALELRAWVKDSAFQKPPSRLGSGHRVKAPRVRTDSVSVSVPSAEVVRGGPLLVGSKTRRAAFAEIEVGAVVDILERDGDWVGVLFQTRWVAPNDGLFWVDRGLLGPERAAK